ncbi:MAG TPA: hypothetical protein VF676_13615 [Flavobacterium sp.]|jgi:hypothetical protein
MKILSILFLAMMLGKGCEEQQQDLAAAVVDYTANTRGFYQKITIQDKVAKIYRSRNDDKVPTTVKISDADWNQLVAAFHEVDLQGLAELKSPTEKRFYDGAAIADLKVIYKDSTYQSSSFDHGFPPAEIEKLVNKINSFAPKE